MVVLDRPFLIYDSKERIFLGADDHDKSCIPLHRTKSIRTTFSFSTEIFINVLGFVTVLTQAMFPIISLEPLRKPVRNRRTWAASTVPILTGNILLGCMVSQSMVSAYMVRSGTIPEKTGSSPHSEDKHSETGTTSSSPHSEDNYHFDEKRSSLEESISLWPEPEPADQRGDETPNSMALDVKWDTRLEQPEAHKNPPLTSVVAMFEEARRPASPQKGGALASEAAPAEPPKKPPPPGGPPLLLRLDSSKSISGEDEGQFGSAIRHGFCSANCRVHLGHECGGVQIVSRIGSESANGEVYKIVFTTEDGNPITAAMKIMPIVTGE